MLLNIIHPYTYKLAVRDTLTFLVGPAEEYEERDKKVAFYVKTALRTGATVLHHQYHDGKDVKRALHDLALKIDPLYKVLFDERIRMVVTSPYGTPLPAKKPAKVTKKGWVRLRKEYTSHSELQELVDHHNPIIFIGGALENCVANAADYFHQHYQKPGQELFYVPELCVSFDEELLAKAKPLLEERDIHPLSYEQALAIIPQAPKSRATSRRA